MPGQKIDYQSDENTEPPNSSISILIEETRKTSLETTRSDLILLQARFSEQESFVRELEQQLVAEQQNARETRNKIVELESRLAAKDVEADRTKELYDRLTETLAQDLETERQRNEIVNSQSAEYTQAAIASEAQNKQVKEELAAAVAELDKKMLENGDLKREVEAFIE